VSLLPAPADAVGPRPRPLMQVKIRETGDLKRLAKDLRQVANGKELRKELTSGIRDVLRPLVPQVRAAYRGLPSGGLRRSGGRADLRVLLAKSVRVEVRTSGRMAGARIRADGRRMPDQMKSLPALVEGEKPRWRHPVFGDRAVWVDQAPSPIFYATLAPHTDRAARAINEVLDDVKRKLEAGR
jgi:hypothetical protein